MTRSHVFTAFTAALALTLTACQASNSDTDSASEIWSEPDIPHAMLSDNVVPSAYRIDLVMNPDEATYDGVVEIDVEIAKPTDQIWFHAKSMTVEGAVARLTSGDEVALNFTEMPADEAPSGIARLNSDDPIPSGAVSLKIPFSTPFNTALNSAYKVERDGEAYVVTQFQPLGAREAFPSFDEPRFKVPFTLSITAPEADEVVANTPVRETTRLENGWVKHDFETTRPLPTYLVAFAVGPYDITEYPDLPTTGLRDVNIPLRGVSAMGTSDQFEYGLANTQGIMEAHENYFGIPYPYEKLDIIAAPEYAFGAMENPGAIVYLEYLMLLDDNAPLSQKRAYARVHSHEIAHQWFGNLVTPYWWEDVWLNESFATWMGNKGIHLWDPEGNFDRLTLNAALGTMALDSLASTRQIRQPLERSEKVLDQFDSITYRKGGGVLSMFESFLGEDVFRDGVRLHMQRFEDGVAKADDFFESIATASGNSDVVDAMKSFVDQPGLPIVKGEMTCVNDVTKINLSQARYAPLGSKIEQGQTWQIPVCAKVGFGNTSEKVCTLMDGKRTTISAKTPGCGDFATLNHNGAGYYRFTMDSAAWTGLFDNLDKLNTREVLTVQDSFEAAFKAGEVEPSVYFEGMARLANHPEYDVASKAGSMISWMDDYLPEESQGELSRFVTDMSSKRFDDIRDADTVEGNLLAPTLLSRLLFVAEDPVLRAEFAKRGANYLGLSGDADKSAVKYNMLTSALSMALIDQGEAAMQPLLNLVKSGSALEKSSALRALSRTEDPDMAAHLRDIALNDTETLTGRQALTLVYYLMNSDPVGAESWEWFKTNFDVFIDRVPDARRPNLPGYAPGCSTEARDDIQSFFKGKADQIPGYELKFAQTLEAVELCAALKSDMAAKMAEALAAR